jgi:hypothetical protein
MNSYKESLISFEIDTLVTLIEDLLGQVEEGYAGAENRLNIAYSVYYEKMQQTGQDLADVSQWELVPFSFVMKCGCCINCVRRQGTCLFVAFY